MQFFAPQLQAFCLVMSCEALGALVCGDVSRQWPGLRVGLAGPNMFRLLTWITSHWATPA